MKTSEYLLLFAVAAFVWASAIQPVSAQHFEGEIRVAFQDLTEDKADEFILFVAENRVTIAGSLKGYSDFPLLRDALTIRADRNDVLIHGEKQVAVVDLRDVEALFKQLFSADQREQVKTEDVEDRVRYHETGETRNFHGYRAAKTVVYDNENENRETHIWLADLNIDWEQIFSPLTRLADTLGGNMDIGDLEWPLDKTPLMVEFFEDGELQMKAEMTHIIPRALVSGEVDVPANKEAISLFQLMMQQN